MTDRRSFVKKRSGVAPDSSAKACPDAPAPPVSHPFVNGWKNRFASLDRLTIVSPVFMTVGAVRRKVLLPSTGQEIAMIPVSGARDARAGNPAPSKDDR
jgi:hypothetical protein